MLFSICFAMLFAKIKKYKISYLFLSWTFYPIIAFTILTLLLQLSVFFNYYYFVQFASYFKTAYLFTFLIPIFYYKQYKTGLIGSASIIVGTLLNKFVMAQNNGKMPVYPSLSYLTGYFKPNAIIQANDNIHIMGNASTPWKVLTDYIDVGLSILSIGDLFIHFFPFLVIYQTIKVLNKNNSSVLVGK
ncbi:MAG: DUF5317 family protein [Eubacteriales bacterium]|nr:DUF5317 family protein [Eubacteriales bacterium]